ncbi:hypothetical protein Tco_1475533 [Tanacetum coccineum]
MSLDEELCGTGMSWLCAPTRAYNKHNMGKTVGELHAMLIEKMGKGSRNKKKVMENIMYFNNGAGPSSSIGIPLTQEFNELRCRIYMSVWVAWRSDRRRLRGWSTYMHITGIGTRVFLSIWQEFIMFRFRVLTTHLVMLSPSTTNTTSSTIRSSQHSSSMTMQRTSSVG